jgi:hypothetical protein
MSKNFTRSPEFIAAIAVMTSCASAVCEASPREESR